MEDTNGKRSKITELLEYIDTRLEELEEEKNELREWSEKDKERRCLEFAVFTREQDEVVSTLTELDEERQRDLTAAKQRREAYGGREREIQVRPSQQKFVPSADKKSRL
jgi:structural maintenance of chromosome 3 (chondroitin sulfate proteoglycan 6)